MARRLVDIMDILTKPWDDKTKLAMFWLIGNADPIGIQRYRPAAMAEDLNCSLSKARQIIDFFESQEKEDGELHGPLLKWTDNSTEMLFLRKWGDYQAIKHIGNPSYNLPDDEILCKLSIKTLRLFGKIYRLFPENFQKIIRKFLEKFFPYIEIDIEKEIDIKNDIKGCAWCAPSPENEAPDLRLIRLHHQEYRKRRGDCPNTSPKVGRNRKDLKPLLALHDPEVLSKVILHALDSSDLFLAEKRGYALSAICDSFDAILDAFKKGKPYGNPGANKPQVGRHNPSPDSAFGPSGPVKMD